MTLLTTYWCFSVIFGLAAGEGIIAGVAGLLHKPAAPTCAKLAGPKRAPRRRGYQTSA